MNIGDVLVTAAIVPVMYYGTEALLFIASLPIPFGQ